MKKTLTCFVMVILLVLSASGTAFASSHPDAGAYSSNILDLSELGPSGSLQLMFAKLQLELAESAKNQALDRMEEIARIQEEQKKVAAFLNTARGYAEEASNTGEATQMPADMAEYMNTNNLSSYDTSGNLYLTNEEWKMAIKSLESHLEELGMETQQQMVYVQDFMGQYNSYLQGANTQIANSNQTLTSLARGQSMYGDSEAGLAVTALLVGLVLGCTITLVAQRFHKRNDKV